MSILELGQIYFGETEGIIDFFTQHHLLASQCNCVKYHLPINCLLVDPDQLLKWACHAVAKQAGVLTVTVTILA